MIKRSLRSFRSFFTNITVEPVCLLMYLGLSIIFSVANPGMVLKICYLTGKENYPEQTVDCLNLKTYPKEFQQKVTDKATMYNTLMVIAQGIVPAVAALILSAWSDRVGRKTNILLGMVGEMLTNLVWVISLALPDSPLWIMPASSLILGCTGRMDVVFSGCIQYLTDNMANKEMLVVRTTFVMACVRVGYTIGDLVATGLLSVLTILQIMVVGMSITFTSMIYVTLFLVQIPPLQAAGLKVKSATAPQNVENGTERIVYTQTSMASNSTKSSDDYRKGGVEKPSSVWKQFYQLFVDIYNCFTRRRPDRKRFFLISVLLANLLIAFGEGTGSLDSLYVLTPPLSFTVQMYTLYHSMSGAIILVGSLTASYLFKRFGLRDTTIMLIALTSSVASPLPFAFARHNWIIYLSPVVGCLSMLSAGAFRAFVAKLVDPDEVGKVLAGQQLSSKAADMISGVMMNKVYDVTAQKFRGTAFLIQSGFVSITLSVVMYTHFSMKHLYVDQSSKSAAKPDISGGKSASDDVNAVIIKPSAIEDKKVEVVTDQSQILEKF